MLPEGRPTIRGISQMFGSLNVLELSLPTKFKAMVFNFTLLENKCLCLRRFLSQRSSL